MHFIINQKPTGKARPRFTGKHAYTDSKTREYEELVKWSFKAAMCEKLEGAIKVHVDAYYGIPKSTTKANAQKMITNELRPTKKPDGDNILKAICDALNGLAYDDDKQIVEMSISKWYTLQEPFCKVTTEEIGE